MRNTPASIAVSVSQLMSWRPSPWRRCSGATASKFRWATSSPKCMMANAAICRSRRATTTDDSGPVMKCCTRAGVQDQVSPCSMRSRDISAISRACDNRANPSVASSDISVHLGFHRRRGPMRQTGRSGGQELHEFLNPALQLRVASLHDLHRVLFDDDIRIHPVPFDDPPAVCIRRAELWHKYSAAVEQRAMVGDADRAAPGALADQRPDFPLAEL